MSGLWPTPFVGAHIFLNEPGKIDGSWDATPSSWSTIRFDAVDVLFISPFMILTSDHTITLNSVDGGSFMERFKWVVRAARSKNPNIKIILEQFYGDGAGTSDFRDLCEGDRIKTYAASVGSFIETWYKQTLPSISGTETVSARVDGWDVDIESGTKVTQLSDILTAVRESLDALRTKLNSERFSISITPAWTEHLNNSRTAPAVDYINMQNYDGGVHTLPNAYLQDIPGLKDSQLVWGITSEQPWKNTANSFESVKAKAEAVLAGQIPGIYTWRLNSDNCLYENVLQVWLYNKVKGVNLPDAKTEEVVARNWSFGGRESQGGRALLEIA